MRRFLLTFALLCCTTIATAQTSEPEVLPLTFEKNLPLAQVSVNGMPGIVFIVDSAARGCLIDRERAAAMGLKPVANGMGNGSGGSQHVGIIPGVRLALGKVELEPTECYTFDMKTLGFDSRVDGVLGTPLFDKHIVEIDYPASRARIFQPRDYRPSPKAELFAARITVGPIVRGHIKARGQDPIDLDLELDTGSAHVLTVCTPVVDRHRLLQSADELTPGNTRGVGGRSPDITGRIEELRIGRFALEKPVVRFSRGTSGAFASEQYYSANVGGDFLKHYRVTFDFPGSRVFLE
jgi:hypothetical protein